MKVIRVMPVLDYGGVEECTTTLARHLDRERFDLRVCTFWRPGFTAERVREMGVPVDVLEVDPRVGNPAATLALYKYFVAQAPDIVHAAIVEANVHAALAGRLAGVPALIAEEVGTPTRSVPARAIFSLIYRLYDRVIGVSRATCDYLVEQERAPADRVELVYNPVSAAFFEVERPERSPDAPFRVVSVGRLVEEKNFAGLLEAFRLLVDEREAELWIIGDGPLGDDLRARTRRLGLEGKVHFPGFRQDIAAQLARADLFVLPSIAEGYGIALVEAMASGVPVIGSTAGGIPEVLGEHCARWSVPPNDHEGWARAMRRVMEMSPDERAALGQAFRRDARARFAPEVYIEEVMDLYERVGR